MNELMQHPKLIIEVLVAYWAFSAIVTGMPKPQGGFWYPWIYDTLHLFAGSVKTFADSRISTLTTTVKVEEAKPAPTSESKS